MYRVALLGDVEQRRMHDRLLAFLHEPGEELRDAARMAEVERFAGAVIELLAEREGDDTGPKGK